MAAQPPRRSTRLAEKARSTSENTTTDAAQPQILYLRIHRSSLSHFPTPTEDQPNPDPLPPLRNSRGHLIAIAADLHEICHFAGDTADWLIRVARFIFEPGGNSRLFTFTTGTVASWLGRKYDTSWRPVDPSESLEATIYEFRPDNNAVVTLTKISLRQSASSITSDTPQSRDKSTAFRDALQRRDQSCIITRHPRTTASHLIPRRLGDTGIQSVVGRFTGSTSAVDRYDPRIGVSLASHLDDFVGTYDMGFWNNGQLNQYVLHNFSSIPLNRYGIQRQNPNEPMLHGRTITLSSHDNAVPLPLLGVFNWHYIQCILNKFATFQYPRIPNIHYHTIPFRTRDDEDEEDWEFDDERNIKDPPYPSYLWDLAQARACQRIEEADRNRAIKEWCSGVSLPGDGILPSP